LQRFQAERFPFVVDTPLGRLDEEHRIGVLEHFTKRAGQAIMLSTDTEIVGKYLDPVACCAPTSFMPRRTMA
jgi:DNA sulfur modification protein DndD